MLSFLFGPDSRPAGSFTALASPLAMALVLTSSGLPACGKATEAKDNVQNKAADAATQTGEKAAEAGHAVKAKADDGKDTVAGKASSLAEELSGSIHAAPMADRRAFCAAEEGIWVDTLNIGPCEDGLVTLEFDGESQQQSCQGGNGSQEEGQCLHRNADGLVYFNDGPSVPNIIQSLTGAAAAKADVRAYNKLFWPAGVYHDYCYHHGQATYGLSKKDCDRRYLSDLIAVCLHADREGLDWFRPNMCAAIAKGHYAAVRSQGQKSFDALNSQVETPPYEPLWQAYGLEEDALDEKTFAELDNRLAKTKIASDD